MTVNLLCEKSKQWRARAREIQFFFGAVARDPGALFVYAEKYFALSLDILHSFFADCDL